MSESALNSWELIMNSVPLCLFACCKPSRCRESTIFLLWPSLPLWHHNHFYPKYHSYFSVWELLKKDFDLSVPLILLPIALFVFILYMNYAFDSLTETKNWSGRNETIETSGRLHPLWPQSKRLHTTWTTDYMYTRQDRWIQTKLVFTLAKNATKPNPLEIILLQTTRKKDSRKTEERLERATVTLGTERIKGSNPWCLWWWWHALRMQLSLFLYVSFCWEFNEGSMSLHQGAEKSHSKT